MCLVFFTLYEQTYGSWVMFTDRLLTKDLFPSLVQPQGVVVWSDSLAANTRIFLSTAPWSTWGLLAMPLAFVVAVRTSERNAMTGFPRTVFLGTAGVMVLLVLRDSVVLPQTAGSLTYLGALFLVVLAPIFAWLWAALGRRGRDPSKPLKGALGLLFGGLSFVPLALAAQQVGDTGAMASAWWLVLAYLLLEIGEMCLAPVSLAAVTELSVPRVVGLMMGMWLLATAFSETLAAQFGKLAAVDIPEGQTWDIAQAAAGYADLFWLMMWIGLGCAAMALVAAPALKRMMRKA